MNVNIEKIFNSIKNEEFRQKDGLELIASENYVHEDVRKAAGSVLTNKYAEGYPGHRYYGGCKHVDEVEQLTIDLAKQLFKVEYANVQPHSGAQANAAVLLACLKPGDTILGLDLTHGGHLSHGSSVNSSGILYNPKFYGVEKETGMIDMQKVAEIALQEKPKLIICGGSAYSRDWNYKEFRKIADVVGAILLADISHPAGLIASGLLSDPFNYCHIVTTTTHKTLRGIRGGLILMGKDFENPFGKTANKGKRTKMMSELLNSAVFPGIQGGPLMHIIAAKGVGFALNLEEDYVHYCKQVVSNARIMAKCFMQKGYKVVSDGTDNHLFLLDLSSKGITGKQAEDLLIQADITTNKNMIPFGDQPPTITNGLRLGTAAITTRGVDHNYIPEIVEWIDEVLMCGVRASSLRDIKIGQIKTKVNDSLKHMPLFV